MATLVNEDGVWFVAGGKKLELGMTIRRKDTASGDWFEGEVRRVSSFDTVKQQHIHALHLAVPGYVSSPLMPGDDVEIVNN